VLCLTGCRPGPKESAAKPLIKRRDSKAAAPPEKRARSGASDDAAGEQSTNNREPVVRCEAAPASADGAAAAPQDPVPSKDGNGYALRVPWPCQGVYIPVRDAALHGAGLSIRMVPLPGACHS